MPSASHEPLAGSTDEVEACHACHRLAIRLHGFLTSARTRVPLATADRLYNDMSRTAEIDRTANAALLDVEQVADRLCVSIRFVRRLVAERRIPYCKIGKFVRIDPNDLDDWIRAQRIDATE